MATITPEAFFHALEPLRADVAGVPAVMQRFRDGDESLIACDRLSIDDSANAAAKLRMSASQLKPAAADRDMEKIFEERRIAAEAEIERVRAEPNKYGDDEPSKPH